MRKSRTPDSNYACTPKSVPPSTLAHKWCQLLGNRKAIHYSFKRWVPHDYDEDRLNKAIDESLRKHPEALKAFPEWLTDMDRVVEDAEKLIKMFMKESHMPQDLALYHVRSWRPDLYGGYMNCLRSDKSVRARFCRMGNSGQNKHAREWLRQVLQQAEPRPEGRAQLTKSQ